MNGQFADEYWEAAVTEIETLEFMKAWEVVEQQDDMNVFRSTWVFKLKRYPDGLIKRFKARFCARSDMQLEGIDFFKTYAPVVQWTTVRLMLMMEVLLGFKSKQGDVTAAFLHANLGEDKKLFALEVVLRLFNVLNKHFAILVKHMVNRSILTIWYSFAIAESIEDRLGRMVIVRIRASSMVMGKYPCRVKGE